MLDSGDDWYLICGATAWVDSLERDDDTRESDVDEEDDDIAFELSGFISS